jgi:tetraacyldisaccharide-1-P 4'-kinase
VFFANYTNEPARDTEGIVLPQNSKVVCASALANNIAFLKWVERNYSVVQHFPYPDHHLFTATELQKWEHAVQSAGAEGVICSHKDWVKLASQPVPFKIFYTLIRPEILFGGEDDLIELLLRKINRNV